ncbi:MAG: FAD:protein FMN transferase [Candidatus Omnitrophica bacterium]|nr:FAD:protein FMN transferase [Candidatus Omnitrophota bacterium]
MSSTNSTILREYYEVKSYFGTSVWIHFFYPAGLDVSHVATACWKKAQSIQTYMNVYGEAMEGSLRWLNRGGIGGVRVHPDVYSILKGALASSRLTDGAFDVTIYPLVEMWKEAAESGVLPDKTVLEDIKGSVGYQHVLLQEPDLVFFTKKNMRIDLGSPASGYFCDEVAKILDLNNIQHYMIDGGGELFCRGKEMGHTPWRVGVQDPFDKDKLITMLELDGKGVSTSGNYEKFATIAGERYAHIIDPRTGYPQKGAASVTVIADTTQMANELSTALCVMGGEKGLAFVRNVENVEALIIENKDGNITQYQTDIFLNRK